MVFISNFSGHESQHSRSPHVRDEREVKVFTGLSAFEGRTVESVQVQQVFRSCSISNPPVQTL